jgi:hypothetical protein
VCTAGELPPQLGTRLTLELYRSLLTNSRIFSALPARLLVPLLHNLQPVVAVPGEIVVREGQRNDRLYFIHRGTVRILKGYRTAVERLLATLEDNDFFGEASLIEMDEDPTKMAARSRSPHAGANRPPASPPLSPPSVSPKPEAKGRRASSHMYDSYPLQRLAQCLHSPTASMQLSSR